MELDNGKANFQFSETEIPLRFPFQIIQNQQVIFDNRPCNRQDLSQYQMFIYTKNVLKDKKPSDDFQLFWERVILQFSEVKCAFVK